MPSGGESTEIIKGAEETSRAVLAAIDRIRDFAYTITNNTEPLVIVSTPQYWNAYLRIHATSPDVDLRFITEITKENLPYVKELMKVFRVRHLQHLGDELGAFFISQDEFFASTTNEQRKEPAREALHSTSKVLIQEHKHIFENFWKVAIPAEDAITSIETGSEPTAIQVIRDPFEAKTLYNQLVSSSKRNVKLFLPSTSAFRREEIISIISKLERAASELGVKVKIILPLDFEIEKRLERYTDKSQTRIGLREIKPTKNFASPKSTILLVDDRSSLVIELKDDSQKEFEKAIGFATYTESKSTVDSLTTIFDMLWSEWELREIAESNKRRAELFQDILAHDIKNYNQVARISAELLREEVKGNKSREALSDSIINAVDGSSGLVEKASKLGKILSDNNPTLIDVKLLEVIDSSIGLVVRANPDRKIHHDLKIIRKRGGETGPFPSPVVVADPLLEEVFANLYSNSVKYSSREEEEEVSLETIVEEFSECIQSKNINPTCWWKISIIDDGKGIDPKIKDRAFNRYLMGAKGAGLGLSIVHALVVERYGGRVQIKDRVPGDHTKGTIVELILPRSDS